jgi:hypothetical protein
VLSKWVAGRRAGRRISAARARKPGYKLMIL